MKGVRGGGVHVSGLAQDPATAVLTVVAAGAKLLGFVPSVTVPPGPICLLGDCWSTAAIQTSPLPL